MLKIYLISLLLPVCLSLSLTPFVIRFAKYIGAIDKPDERKIHKSPIPRMGGLAPFISFITTVAVIYFLFPASKLTTYMTSLNWMIAASSLIIILLLGVCDDVWVLKPGQKFFVQFVAGSFVYFAGFRFASFTLPFSSNTIELGVLSYPLTVVWVIGITNAFNLIDGLDGLASGIAMISCSTVAAIAILHHDVTITIISVALAGSLIGFLKYNFNPAKIFLGDSGSLFLGFTLAFLSLQSSTKGSTAFSILIPILALGVPVIDTLMAMLRRMLKWFLPEQSLKPSVFNRLHSMFLPDRRHIHHQLLAQGLSQREAVMVLYLVSCAFGICAFLVTAGSINSSFIIIGVGIFAAIAARKLGYREMSVIKNGILLKVYCFTFLKHSIIRIFLDAFSVLTAFFISVWLISPANLFQEGLRYLAYALVVIGTIQLFAFVLGGLYKHTIPLLGLGDFMQIVKSALIAVLITAGILNFFPLLSLSAHLAVAVMLDFYFLVTLIVGSRITFHALNYIFNRESSKGKKILIYGADYKGLIALQALLNRKENEINPVGFLDDDPRLEGKYLNGYPIFGSHWRLEGMLRKNIVDEIIVANEEINLNVFGRIKKIASQFNIPVRISNLEFKSVSSGVYKVNEVILNQARKLNAKTAKIILESK